IGLLPLSTSPYKLDVCGTIRGKRVIVNTLGCDFVFARDYKLMSIDERIKFRTQFNHLPYMKSAKEMQEQGADVEETTMGLLQNVEEHDIYITKHDEQINEQKKEIKELKDENKDLKKDMQSLKDEIKELKKIIK